MITEKTMTDNYKLNDGCKWIFDEDCIHCTTYENDRKKIINKHKNKFLHIEKVFPINIHCPSKQCKTYSYEADSEDEKFEPGVNYDNWDLEPDVKIPKKKNEISELQSLFGNLNLKKKSPFKKKKNYKQLKITSYDISNLMNKMNINAN